jgi:hypothetical protein
MEIRATIFDCLVVAVLIFSLKIWKDIYDDKDRYDFKFLFGSNDCETPASEDEHDREHDREYDREVCFHMCFDGSSFKTLREVLIQRCSSSSLSPHDFFYCVAEAVVEEDAIERKPLPENAVPCVAECAVNPDSNVES